MSSASAFQASLIISIDLHSLSNKCDGREIKFSANMKIRGTIDGVVLSLL